jgi:hypothetical protein
MDEAHREETSMRDALNILEQLGGWAVLLGDKWTQQNFTWYKMVERANILGFDTNRILSAGAYASEKKKILGGTVINGYFCSIHESKMRWPII